MTDLLVPVRESVTLRNTVAYAAEQAAESGAPSTIHFVYPVSRQFQPDEPPEQVTELLDRVDVWAEEDLGDGAGAVTVRTAFVGESEYLFNPSDYATVLREYADAHGVDRVVVDPEFNPSGMTPLLPRLESALESRGLDVEVAPVERPTRRFPLVRRASLGQFAVLFLWAFGFYTLLAGGINTFDLATGGVSAAIVAAVLWRVSLSGSVEPVELTARLGRLVLYVPVLLWEIVVANFQIAYVVLHPDLPIDPEMVEFDAAVWSELPVTTLANSITLTPGTLTVDVSRRHFTVHTLIPGARDDLLDGRLERLVRFVFYGRAAMRIATPAERAAATDEPVPDGGTDVVEGAAADTAETDGEVRD